MLRAVRRSTQEHVILAGNPGAGKSTLLNSLIRKIEFQSGWSAGTGKTVICKKYQHTDGKVYCDTPGLADVNISQEAADAIFQLLSSVLTMKLIFVVTLEGGRVKPADVASILAILNACTETDVHNKFGVVINKMSGRGLQRLTQDEKTKLAACFQGKFSTDSVYYNVFVPDFEDAENVLPAVNDHRFYDFVHSIPTMTLNKVLPLKIEYFAEDMERLEVELGVIMNSSAAELDQLQERRRQVESKARSDMEQVGTLHLQEVARAHQTMDDFTLKVSSDNMEQAPLPNLQPLVGIQPMLVEQALSSSNDDRANDLGAVLYWTCASCGVEQLLPHQVVQRETLRNPLLVGPTTSSTAEPARRGSKATIISKR